MKAKDFYNLLQTVEFELTQRQRYLLFEEIYAKYSFADMAKFEKTMLKQIKSSVEMLSEETAKDVTQSCNTILKAYKEWES